MTMRLCGIVTLLGATLALGACQSPPELDVERQWSDTMRRLNMFGFYPQTEDVQPGDLYLHAPPRTGGASLPRFSLIRIAAYHPDDVLSALQGQQSRGGQPPRTGGSAGDRLRIQPLPADWSGLADNRTVPLSQTADCGGYDIGHADEQGCRVRLQRTTIPGLAVGRITYGQLGLSGIYGNFGARLGLGGTSETAVTIRLRNVQELSLDAWRLDHMRRTRWDSVLRLAWAETLLEALRELRSDLLGAVCAGDAAHLAREGVAVVVINRVIYAGGLEYGFTRNAEGAIRAALDLQSVLPGQPQAPVAPPSLPGVALPGRAEAAGSGGNVAGSGGSGSGTTAGGSTGSGGAMDPNGLRLMQAASAARLAGLLQGLTGETGGDGRAGLATSFGMGSFGNLSLRENFNRLVAVGAGSRQSYGFHDMLAGSHTLSSPDEGHASMAAFRHSIVERYCADNFPERFRDGTGLRRAMGFRSHAADPRSYIPPPD